MRCAYSAGALVALAEQVRLVEPDILIAASGSAGSSAYYLSKQYDKGKKIWLSELTNPKFISFDRFHIIDIDYLIDEVFRAHNPFDLSALHANRTQWMLPLTRTRDGETVWVEPPRDERVYEYLRAAKAIPFVYGKPVSIDNEEYLDGEFGCRTEDYVHKAAHEGAERILVIESNPGTDFQVERRAFARLLLAEAQSRGHAGIVAAAERGLSHRVSPISKDVQVITIAPSQKLDIGPVTHDSFDLREAFNLGYEDITTNEAIRNWFAGDAQ